MINQIIETSYPLNFHEDLTRRLGSYLKNRNSVTLVGMKRVGISNFLRFFLYHKGIAGSFIKEKQSHLFIPIDLYDLVELEIYPFWILTLKRIVDCAEETNLNSSIKKSLQALFLYSIQSQNLFLVIDSVRKSLRKIVEAAYLPTIFFIRFDRMKNAASKEFIYNLEGLKYATYNKLAYVFTTYRKFNELNLKVFNLSSQSLAPNILYIKPAKLSDLEIISAAYFKKARFKLYKETKSALLDLVGGYVQYMQIALIIMNESRRFFYSKEDLYSILTTDERIYLQSEELWESLTSQEKQILMKFCMSERASINDRESAKYLWDTGLIYDHRGKTIVFSPIFNYFLKSITNNQDSGQVDFTKKELFLFNFLKSHSGEVCEREAIIEAVWPEEEALGVSDWAIDRLIARVRNKLKQQKNQFSIITVRTRGYKLIEE